MRATTLCFALTFALLGTSAYANASDENKYICLDPTKFTASKQVTFSGSTTSCDTWIDLAQGSSQVFNGIAFDSTFSAAAQTTTVQNGLKMYAGPYGGNGLGCCSDGKSAAFKNHAYFCQDANDWLPDKTYTFSGGGTSTCTEWLEFDATGLTNEDFTASWSCDGKSDAIRQKVQNEGAEIMGCCGSTKKSACYKERGNVCADPSSFLPWNTFNSEGGGYSGTCYKAVHDITKDSTGSCYGEDFSQTWSCSAKSSFCQAQLFELARGGCCGSAGQSASACHGHYSGAGSFNQVGIFAISIAVAIALA